MIIFKKYIESIRWFYDTKIHFIQLHYAYIFFMILISSGLFQLKANWSYIDTLFMATSAVTNTGLNTIEMSRLNGWQLLIIYIGSLFGSHIMISIIILYIRRHYFSKRFEDILIFNKAQQLKEENERQFERIETQFPFDSIKRKLSFMSFRATPEKSETRQFRLASHPVFSTAEDSYCIHPTEILGPPQAFMRRTVDSVADSHSHQAIVFAENIGIQREIARKRLEQDRKYEDINRSSTNLPKSNESTTITIPEPTQKSELTRQQRYRLGGAEYRALDFLTRLVPIYYLFFIFGFGFFIRLCIALSPYSQQVLQSSNSNGPVNQWSFSFFCSLSSFNNLGLVQLDASMVPFQQEPCLLIMTIVLILAGNTAYALILRLIIWILFKTTPSSYAMRKETLSYLLDHPRRCYTTLFPATQTKWLLIVLIGITLIEFVTFISLNYWLPILEGVSWGSRILDGLFQSVATRSAGYSIVDLLMVNPGTHIIFVVAMYISVYPVAISMRNSNVYQERALGIYGGEDNETGEVYHKLKRYPTISSVMTASKKALMKPDFFVMTQIQRQLTSDIGWVICCVFAICVIETESIMSSKPITIHTIMYECVSAFANVGASTGFPLSSSSQSTQYHSLSKLILIILMYRGRHRGLPAAIDRAVLLPSEQLEEKEQEDNLLKRRNTSFSLGDGAVMFYNGSHTL
ncbi:TrkH-domain-containing protein [Backusella circina FSU 941]|nr:TrkH-domain-containing protein [Backusella circina FSU 941]